MRCSADAGHPSPRTPYGSSQYRLSHSPDGRIAATEGTQSLCNSTAEEGSFDFIAAQQVRSGIAQYNLAYAEHVGPVGDFQGL
jgi:hypothetical protein